MKKFIIIGDGKLGSEIHNQTNWDIISRQKDNFNINDISSWDYFFNEYDIIINCIANTNTYGNGKEEHINVNTKFVYDLVDFCNMKNKKLIHISTDYVYANSERNVSEDDIPIHHNSWYAYSKLLADGYIETRSNDFLICRLSHKTYPFEFNNGWIDVLTNADYTPIICNLVIKLIRNENSGIINVGTDPKTIYELGLKSRFVEKSFAPSHVPKNVLMSLEKLKNIIN